MMQKYHFMPVVFSMAVVFFGGCLIDNRSTKGGSGTDVQNPTIAGTILEEGGQAASDVEITFVPTTYNPLVDSALPDSQTTKTDKNGRFEMKIRSGSYNIQAYSLTKKTSVIIPNVPVDSNNITLHPEKLQAPGSVVVPVPEDAAVQEGYVFIPGTTIFRKIDGSVDRVVLDSVPPGLIAVVYYFHAGMGESPKTVSETIVIVSDSIIISDSVFLEWPHIKGSVTYNQQPLKNTNVELIESNAKLFMKPDSQWRTYQKTTNLSGEFSLKRVPAGFYNLQATHTNGQETALLIQNIQVLTHDSVIQLPSQPVSALGTVTIHIPDSLQIPESYVYIPGTRYIHTLKPGEDTAFFKLPEGNFGPVRFYFDNTPRGIYDFTIVENINIRKNERTAVGLFHKWTQHRKIVFNTTQSGIALKSDLIGYPTLIRLDETNFNFKETLSRGEDLRFTKPDSTPLPHQIERWDAKNQRAVIWVKLDTLKQSSSTQFIRMFWGNSSAPYNGDGAKVFDISNGFAGVWHLNEDGSTTAGGYKDATANGADGTGVGMDTNSKSESIVGFGQHFNGTGNYITVSREEKFNFSEQMTISAWVKVNTFDINFQTIVAKGDHAWRLARHNNTNTLEFSCDSASFRQLIGEKTVNDGNWHHIVGIFDNPHFYLYIDGELDATMENQGSINQTTSPVWIGNNSGPNRNARYFNGMIDEVRTSYLARPLEWIMLDYLIQKGETPFYTFENE